MGNDRHHTMIDLLAELLLGRSEISPSQTLVSWPIAPRAMMPTILHGIESHATRIGSMVVPQHIIPKAGLGDRYVHTAFTGQETASALFFFDATSLSFAFNWASRLSRLQRTGDGTDSQVGAVAQVFGP
jgi:hypothetical protein